MKRILTLLSFSAISLLSLNQTQASLPSCSLNTPAKTLCALPLLRLSPTQYSIGMIAVQDKVQDFKKADAKGDYPEILYKKPVPVVIGANEFFMIDRHHTMRALWEWKHLPTEHVVIEVIQNWQGRTDFFHAMETHAPQPYCYLKDPNGERRSLKELHQDRPTIWTLTDDPYRSLSWAVREEKGYRTTDSQGKKIYFIEFIWADFFRQFFSKDEIKAYWKETVQRATILSHTPLAKELPGYIPR